MTTRTDIMDLTGAPLEIADLTGEETRALGVLAEAGLIAPLGGAPQRKSAPQKAAPRTGNSRKAPARTGQVQGTLMAA